jgi:hypothetical protein
VADGHLNYVPVSSREDKISKLRIRSYAHFTNRHREGKKGKVRRSCWWEVICQDPLHDAYLTRVFVRSLELYDVYNVSTIIPSHPAHGEARQRHQHCPATLHRPAQHPALRLEDDLILINPRLQLCLRHSINRYGYNNRVRLRLISYHHA